MPQKASFTELEFEHTVALPSAALVLRGPLLLPAMGAKPRPADDAPTSFTSPTPAQETQLNCTAFCLIFLFSSQSLVNSLSHYPYQVCLKIPMCSDGSSEAENEVHKYIPKYTKIPNKWTSSCNHYCTFFCDKESENLKNFSYYQ